MSPEAANRVVLSLQLEFMRLPADFPPSPSLPDQPLRFVLHFVRFYVPAVLACLLFETGQAVCGILLPWALRQIMDAVSAALAVGAPAWPAALPALWIFAGLNLGILLSSRASGTILVMLGPALRRRIRRDLFGYLQHHSQRYFLGSFAGSLANRIAETSLGSAQILWTVLFDFWPLLISFGVSLVLLAGVDGQLAGTLGLWLVGYVGVSFLLSLRARRYARDYAAARSLVSGKIVDSVTNIMNAKLFARRGYEREYLEGFLNFEVSRARRVFWFMEAIRWFQFSAAMGLIVSVVAQAVRLWGDGHMTAGAFAMSASLALLLIEQARGLSRKFLDFFEYVGNVSDGVGMIVRPHEVRDSPTAHELNVTQGAIHLQNLHFAYVPGRPVFAGLTLKIRGGQKVGLVGYSGSGKSSLLNLLLRLFEPQQGQISIDGQSVANVTQESLRQHIAMIPQDPMLFHRSLRDNIRYGRLEASDAEVLLAAQKAHAHEFILEAEEGYDALVGERGVKLSGGQRQRIALARAILKDAPILLLDEATSSLDSITERHIQDSLEELMRNKTVLVVAHRLSTLARMDRIVVFHHGAVIEDGSPSELLALNGHYARMWAMQAGGFLPDDEAPLAAEDLAEA